MDHIIRHNEQENRFETEVDGLVLVVDYIRQGDVFLVTHTQVPEQLEGRGIAAALTKTLLDYVHDNGYKVQPVCSYALSYMRRHPEYQPLIN